MQESWHAQFQICDDCDDLIYDFIWPGFQKISFTFIFRKYSRTHAIWSKKTEFIPRLALHFLAFKWEYFKTFGNKKQTNKNKSTKENKSNLPSTNELLKLAEQNNNTAVIFKVFKDIIELKNRTRFTLVKMKSDYYILELLTSIIFPVLFFEICNIILR